MKHTIKINKQLKQHPTFVNVDGEIDTSTAEALRRQLASALLEDTQILIVRLKHVPFMNSAGVAVLLQIIKEAKEKSKQVAILEPSEAATKAMQIVDLEALIKVYDSVSECSQCTMLPEGAIRTNIYTREELAARAGESGAA